MCVCVCVCVCVFSMNESLNVFVSECLSLYSSQLTDGQEYEKLI